MFLKINLISFAHIHSYCCYYHLMSVSARNQTEFTLRLTFSVCLYPWSKSLYVNTAAVIRADVDLITMRLTFRVGGSHFRLDGVVYVTYCIKIEQQEYDSIYSHNTVALPPAGH